MITDNIMTGNNANFAYPGHGGAIYCENTSALISNNIITHNASEDSGGGLYCIGGTPTIVGNTITNNTSNHGGGVYLQDGSTVLCRNIIQDNTATQGGGVYCRIFRATCLQQRSGRQHLHRGLRSRHIYRGGVTLDHRQHDESKQRDFRRRRLRQCRLAPTRQQHCGKRLIRNLVQPRSHR